VSDPCYLWEMILRIGGLLVCFAAAAAAQNWEIAGEVGDGIYHNATITSSSGSAQAGMQNGLAASFVVCENLYEHFSGEFRYLYQDGQPFLSLGSTTGTIPGASHTLVYEGLIQFRRRSSWWRPYVALGGGAKWYVATGSAPTSEPLPKEALLLANNQWVGVGSAGVGLKLKVQEHIVLRFDVRDFITQFPKKQITPAAGASASGWLQQITPMGGVGIVF
jgi:hypothetical protein